MRDEAQYVHEIPFSWRSRLFCCLLAPVPLLMTYEVWILVWPLTWLSPIILILILVAVSISAGLLYAGLTTPSRIFHFRRGVFEIEESWPLSRKITSLPVSAIISIEVRQFSEDGEDWDRYHVYLVEADGNRYTSRRFFSAAEAEAEANRFRRAMGL